MRGLLALLFETLDLHIQMLNLFLQLPFALLIDLHFVFRKTLG